MAKFDLKSLKAEEFINHEEILETLEYAESNKHNRELIEAILEKPNYVVSIHKPYHLHFYMIYNHYLVSYVS